MEVLDGVERKIFLFLSMPHITTTYIVITYVPSRKIPDASPTWPIKPKRRKHQTPLVVWHT